MNILKKALTVLLAVLVLCPLLSACTEQPVPPADAHTTVATTAPKEESDLFEEPILLCDATKSYFRIVRPVTTYTEITDAALKIMDYPATQSASQLVFRWGTDRNEAEDAEILVGYTNRPESLEVLKTIDFDDFAIVMVNGKIVVAAHTPERLTQAVDYLCEHLLEVRVNQNGKKEIVYLGNYTYTGPKEYLFNLKSQNQPENYVIVYKKGSDSIRRAAEQLQTALKDTYGLNLSVVDDSAAEQPCEILIGNVNRSIAKEYFEQTSKQSIFSYVTAVKGKKLLIGAMLDQVTAYMIDSFCAKYVHSSYSYLFNLPVDTEDISSDIDFSESTALAEGADLRVMSFNILCELWNDLAVIEGREVPVVAPILTYQPDILGLQEVSDAWYVALDPLLKPTYAIVDYKDERGLTNFSPLLYNTETMTLLEHGCKALRVGGNGLRVMSWGYFERKSDGARIVAVNTHWNVNADVSERTAQSADMAAFVTQLKEKYKCPVVTTGDYNTRMSETQLDHYTRQANLRDAGTTATVVNRAIKTTHTLFNPNHRGEGEAIDHVFASPELEILFYNVLIDQCLAPSSDHYPIYADIKLAK